jgi:hypothetical protein
VTPALRCRYAPPPAPAEHPSDAFVRKSKSAADDFSRGDRLSGLFSDEAATKAFSEAKVDAAQLPGATLKFRNIAAATRPSDSDHEQSPGRNELALSPASSCRSSPANDSPALREKEPNVRAPCSPARFDMPHFTEEQSEYFEAAVLYLRLTVQGFSISIGSHSRFCKPALRVLMSVKYIAVLVATISLYSGVPWLAKYQDSNGTAVYPWWAIYLNKSAIVGIEVACVAFLFFDFALNMFAQGARTYYKEHLVANVSYTLVLIWFLTDLVNSMIGPESRCWSQGLRPIALVRSIPKLEQVVSVFASTLMKSLKLTFFAATFLLIIGCLSVVVTRYACAKGSVAEYCANLRTNWGSLDVSMLASFVIITGSGYARLFQDFLSILFSSSQGDKTGALNFSMVVLMCAIVFGGALGLTALYTASVFDSFKKARAQQYLNQLGMEHRYLVESYMAACSAFEADEVDGLSEVQIGLIIQSVIPRFHGRSAMLSLLFRLIDVDGGGTVNVIEYCRLCGIIMLDFHVIHEGAPEDVASLPFGSSPLNDTREGGKGIAGAPLFAFLQRLTDPIMLLQTAKHAVVVAWEQFLKSHAQAQLAARFIRRFCASKFARRSIFLLLWSHLVLVVINAQIPPFKQDKMFENLGISNNTITYQYRQNLNDVFDVFILVSSIYVLLVLWLQYAFSIAKINTAMLFIPVELIFVAADFVNLASEDFCLDCIWYARILRSVRAPVIALSVEPFVPLMKAISQLVSTLAVYIAFFYIVLNFFTNLGHLAFRDLGFTHKGVPALSFSTLQQTLTITIELTTADDWDEIRFDLYSISKQRIHDIFFVFYYIVFNLCTTNVVTSLAIECFEYLHEKEANEDLESADKRHQQAFDSDMHMKNDESYEMMLAPDGIDEIWTGKNDNHAFVETHSAQSMFHEEKFCCLCNQHAGGAVLECSLCHLAVHFDCWQKAETATAALSHANDIQKLIKISFLRSTQVPACISKLRFDVLRMHFSVYVKKHVNLLDLLILGPQVTTRARYFEQMCICILSIPSGSTHTLAVANASTGL